MFNFILRPVDQIEPWGAPPRRTLSWFGLSDGWYWLELGGQEVLRANLVERAGELPYVGYQVVRLWEDLLDLLPAILEPVPDDVAAACSLELDARREQDSMDLSWWSQRTLDFSHLVRAPRVHLWRVEAQLHVAWASHPEGQELWAPVRGATTMPLETFLHEVTRFDARFLSAMGERVRTVVEAGVVAGVDIDLEHLQREQAERSEWLQSALRRSERDQPWSVRTDWEAVRSELARVQA